MKLSLRAVALTGLGLLAAAAEPATAQKQGGTLRLDNPNNPGNMSMLESPTITSQMPLMSVYNNLIVFDQHKPQVSLDTIVPDLATSWSWNEDGTALTFKLRRGVKWHDGKPFTAADVKCSWDLRLDKASEKLRFNFQKSDYYNLDSVTTNGDDEVIFHLKRPQPAFPMVLADGFSVVTPCHVSPTEMRQHPIGTGPFKFVEFKPNEHIRLARNPEYWKPDRPYLDGIEYTIIPNLSTAMLAFTSHKFDMTFPFNIPPPLLKDVRSQVPEAICELKPNNINHHLLVNREKPPFSDPDLRRAMALSIDRKAFIDILSQGQADIGGALQPPPEGLWGMSADELAKLPGYNPDVQKNREEARRIIQKLGYGPNNPLKIKVTTRDWSIYRDPAVLLIDQLKQVYIDGELELVDTSQFFPKILRKDFTVALSLNPGGPDPDPFLQLFYGCGAGLNWDGYCDAEIDKLINRQSAEADPDNRKTVLWAIERKLVEDNVRPIIYYARGGTCLQPYVKGLTIMVNHLYGAWRMEDVWIDK